MENQNSPYRPPVEDLLNEEYDAFLISERNEFLSQEKAVKSVSIFLFGLGFTFIFMGALNIYANSIQILSLTLNFVGILFFGIGYGIYKFNQLSRIIVTLIIVALMYYVPSYLLFYCFMLYIFYCDKGKMVFTEKYRDTMMKTSRIKSAPSIISTIIFLIPIAIFNVSMFRGFLSAMNQ